MDESVKWEAKSQFQSSQPVRVGSAQGREQAVNKKVSIIPTREGWVEYGYGAYGDEYLVSIIPTREGWV